MEITEERLDGGIAVVGLAGRLDTGSVESTEKRLLELIDAETRSLVLDLAGLTYISSAGLRVLLVIARKLKSQKGGVVLCAVQRYVKEVFDISGFSTIFPFCDTREQALASVQPPR
jgi:stage II sporulation protein AA (anti-sigma F factor antagonist)